MNSSLSVFAGVVIHTNVTPNGPIQLQFAQNKAERGTQGHAADGAGDRRIGINPRFMNRRLVELDRNVVLVLDGFDDILERSLDKSQRRFLLHGLEDRLLAAAKLSGPVAASSLRA